MSVLTLIQDNKKHFIPFEGTPLLRDLLISAGYAVYSPCGGKGKCLKCAVNVSGTVSPPTKEEINAETRLACKTVLTGDATAVILGTKHKYSHIQTDTGDFHAGKNGWHYGAAVDIGTTTVVLKLFSADGTCVGQASALNPQRVFSSDVIGRIGEALNGKGALLQWQITDCINALLLNSCAQAGIQKDSVERMVITGNTAMLYLLTGRTPESISRFPFKADTLFGTRTEVLGIKTYLPPCMNAFVGADITMAVLDSAMCENNVPALLCDIGTNGEIALFKDGKLYVTSAAAGPAFEGAEISCGCGSVDGAIYRVWEEDGGVYAHTLGNKPAVGICGTGLIDAASAFLEVGSIDENGNQLRPLHVSANGGNVYLTGEDIRALQLAKAAVAAGIEILLKRTETKATDVQTLLLAGGFGNKLDPYSAANIGLIPASLASKTRGIGNAALSGAVKMLFDRRLILVSEAIASSAVHIELGGNADFNDAFIRNMKFTETK